MTEPTRRQRRKTLTDKMVAGLPRRRKRYIQADPELRGHYVRVPPQGPCVFAAVARSPYGKQVWATLGTADVLMIEPARDKARGAIKRIKEGLSPFEAPPVQPDTVADVVATWLRRHVESKGLRTGDELKRVLERHVLPVWGSRVFTDIRRSDIARLLDSVEDASGAWVSDSVLAALRSVASWYSARDDDYTPPFTKNMRRVPASARSRSRILDDDELRAVWKAAEADDDAYGAFVRLALLCGQRRAKLADLKWGDLTGDVWHIRREPREKGAPAALRLPPAAMKVINAQPHFAGSPFVFTGRSNGPLAGFSHRHALLMEHCGVTGFSVHDLRRCCRSLMARASVPSEHAERVLGHAIAGVEGTYNRHDYMPEMADALKRLARLITQIVDGEPGGNVVVMRQPAAQP